MGDYEKQCGSIARWPIGAVADQAARILLEFTGPRAVCVDPQGRVTVEPPNSACLYDMVGVYSGDVGLLALSRMLVDDLRDEAVKREFRVERIKRGRGRPKTAIPGGLLRAGL